MKNVWQFTIILSLALALVLSGCSARQETPVVQPPTMAPSSTPLPPTQTEAPTATLEPSATPTITPTLLPFEPVPGTVVAASVNLRGGPGTLFEIVERLYANESIAVFGQSSGGGWLLVQSATNRSGWVIAGAVVTNGSAAGLPFFEPAGTVTVAGRLQYSEGSPVAGVNVTLSFTEGGANLVAEAVSDTHGDFFFFLPEGSEGTWQMQVGNPECDSPVAEPNCTLAGTFSDQGTAEVTLPQTEAVIFTYTP